MNQKSQFSGYKHGKNEKPGLHRSRLNRSIISLLLFFPSVLLAEDKLSYLEALGLASENSPDVRIATADTNIANQQKNRSDSVLPEAPSLEGSITRGSSTDSIEILDLNNTAISNSGSKPVRGWEVGISQKVDLAGQRGLRQEQGEANQRYYTARLHTSRMEARSRARELYIQATLLSEWEEHLSEHLNRFYRLRARFGGSYIDRRLGSYSLVALNMGIQTLNSEREEVRLRKQTMIRELALLLNRSEDSLQLQSIDRIAMPGLPPLETLQQSMDQDGTLLKEKRARLEAALKQSELESRRIWPSPSIFLYGGQQRNGQDSSVTLAPSNKETYMRAGIRFPLNFMGPERFDASIALEEAKKAEVELNTETSRATMQLNAAYANYSSLRKQFTQMHTFLNQAERFLPALDQALMGRRISYFEFWGEHERYHALFQRSLDVRLAAARALSELEMLTGKTLE